MPPREALERLDRVMNELVEADQNGSGVEPLQVARQLGEVRALLVEGASVIPRAGGEGHWRCENCGTISHGLAAPERCPTCGHQKFFKADLEQAEVDAGPA